MKRMRFAMSLAVVALGISGSSAYAGDKPYSLNITPQASDASAAQTYTLRIANRAASQSLGSVNIGAPAGFGLSAPLVVGVGSASTDGSTVFVRNLALAPGRSVDVKVTANTLGVTGEWSWTSAAKQANDFNGTGNDFELDASRSDTSVVVNGSSAQYVQCPEEPAGTTQTCRTQITHRGTTTDGPYTVRAKVQADPQVPNNAGTLSLQLPYSRNLECTGVVPSSPVTAFTNGPTGRGKTVDILVDRTTPITAVGPVCYAAPYPFATLSPGVPYLEGDQLFFVGTLLDCLPATDLVNPCIASAQIVNGNFAFTVRIPALLPDPGMRG